MKTLYFEIYHNHPEYYQCQLKKERISTSALLAANDIFGLMNKATRIWAQYPNGDIKFEKNIYIGVNQDVDLEEFKIVKLSSKPI